MRLYLSSDTNVPSTMKTILRRWRWLWPGNVAMLTKDSKNWREVATSILHPVGVEQIRCLLKKPMRARQFRRPSERGLVASTSKSTTSSVARQP
jgi:hypothetical protein